jgi:hypothetical protein
MTMGMAALSAVSSSFSFFSFFSECRAMPGESPLAGRALACTSSFRAESGGALQPLWQRRKRRRRLPFLPFFNIKPSAN